MNIVQDRLVSAYVVLVLSNDTKIEDVPESRVIGGVTCPIRSVVAERIANL